MFMYGRRAFVLVLVTIIMLAVASYSLVLLTKAQSYTHVLYTTLGKEKDRVKSRVESVSLLNVALSVMKQRTQELHFTKVKSSTELEDLLNDWLNKTTTVPGESELWDSIYEKIYDEGYGAVMNVVNAYRILVETLIENGVLPSDILDKSKAVVYKFFSPPSVCYLLVVKNGSHILWATASQKTLNQYLFVTNRETLSNGEPIYFITGDVLDGPVYTTDEINIWGDPVFKGSVTAAGSNIVDDSNPVFENGFNQLVGEPEFVLDNDFANSVMNDYSESVRDISEISNGDVTGIYLPSSEFYSDARVDGIYVDENTAKLEIYKWESWGWWGWWEPVYEIIYDSTPLNEDGTMDATLVNLDTNEQIRFSFNGIILSETDLYISSPDETSFFSGLITLASQDDVYIRGNIVYSHLRTGPNSFVTDVQSYNDISEGIEHNKLNIVAYDSIVMRYYVPDNLYITASLFALTGEFTLENYWSVEKDTLHVYGAIIQKYRGPIGTFGGWGGNTGFLKDYHYDKRLYSPPYPYKTPTMGGKMSVLDIR